MAKGVEGTIVFKCQFGGENGWGHVVRSSALANEFLRNGWKTVLCSEGPIASLPDEVARAFIEVVSTLPEQGAILFVDEMYTSQCELEKLACEWKERNPGSVVAGVDDMQERSMSGFDVVLNPELGLTNAVYLSKHMLLGERYALLRSGFALAAPTSSEFTVCEDRKRVLVMMGGTDAYGLLDTTLNALAASEGAFFPVVVAGEQALDSPALKRFGASRVLRNLSSSELASCFREVQFGIIGCGSSAYELAAMNLPFVGISLVDNQEAMARRIEENWNMPIVHCEGRQPTVQEIRDAIQLLRGRGSTRYSQVDTKGAARVHEFLVDLLKSNDRR